MKYIFVALLVMLVSCKHDKQNPKDESSPIDYKPVLATTLPDGTRVWRLDIPFPERYSPHQNPYAYVTSNPPPKEPTITKSKTILHKVPISCKYD